MTVETQTEFPETIETNEDLEQATRWFREARVEMEKSRRKWRRRTIIAAPFAFAFGFGVVWLLGVLV
jgi:hypothetical protein